MSDKRHTVLFIGAGASAACGYPLTGQILSLILNRLRRGSLGDDFIKKHRSALRRTLKNLIPANGQVPSITEVLSIIDYCLESGEELFPEKPGYLKLETLRWLLNRAMARVITRVGKVTVAPKELVEWVQRQAVDGTKVSIVSTNYDTLLDLPLLYELDDWEADYVDTDFGFTWREPIVGEIVHPSSSPKVQIYKLHGSMNWLACSRCGYVYVNFEEDIVLLADEKGPWATCHCTYRPLRALLVAPSLVRRYRDRTLLNIWSSALEALRSADRIIFVGYSLPTEDVGIRALLMRSQSTRKRLPEVQVISGGKDALSRYRQLFPACEYTASGLRRYLDGKCRWMKVKGSKKP